MPRCFAACRGEERLSVLPFRSIVYLVADAEIYAIQIRLRARCVRARVCLRALHRRVCLPAGQGARHRRYIYRYARRAYVCGKVHVCVRARVIIHTVTPAALAL